MFLDIKNNFLIILISVIFHKYFIYIFVQYLFRIIYEENIPDRIHGCRKNNGW